MEHYRTCAGHLSYFNRVLGAVVVKPRTRGIRDLSGCAGIPWSGLRLAVETLRQGGAFGIIAYRLYRNNWAVMYEHEGGRSWELGATIPGSQSSTGSTYGTTNDGNPPVSARWEQSSFDSRAAC